MIKIVKGDINHPGPVPVPLTKLPNETRRNYRTVLYEEAKYAIMPIVMAEYRKRVADSLLARKLAGMGAVLVDGDRRFCLPTP